MMLTLLQSMKAILHQRYSVARCVAVAWPGARDMESKSVSEDLLICKSLPSGYIFKGFHV